jgi:GNAT superfamily N-acetyltransferase
LREPPAWHDNAAMSAPVIVVRALKARDVAAACTLLGQLGYSLELAEVHHRLEAVSAAPGHGVFIAEADGVPVALLHVFERPTMEKPTEAVVQSVVVDRRYRALGIGRQMMAFAERWARERGLASVSLASRIDRHDSHAFYDKLGYRQIATSHLFRKELAGI